VLSSADSAPVTPSKTLEDLAVKALGVAKKARSQRRSLGGDNFYANKLAILRAEATNVLRSLSSTSADDAAAITPLVEVAFSPSTNQKERTHAVRQLRYQLQTTWRQATLPAAGEGLFPLSILAQTKRGYLVVIGRQMNGCFTMAWHDAAAVMMRRLIEVAIIEAFEAKGMASKIKDASGNYLQLSDLVTKALAETKWTLSRNAKRSLPGLRDVGHMSAHGRYFCARQDDLDALRPGCRIVVEEFLHHAALL
jgi:hypothetical protein